MSISAYPLQWPVGWPRTDAACRAHGHFGTRRQRGAATYTRFENITITVAAQRVLAELQRMGVSKEDVVISTNLKTRLDGLPRSDQPGPADSGAAVYWETRAGDRRVMAVDQYRSVAGNLAAIAATLEAMRAIERHGGAQILDRAFTGFVALPAPTRPSWWQILQCPASSNADLVHRAYRIQASKCHPDRPGGSDEKMAEINVAYQEALKALGEAA